MEHWVGVFGGIIPGFSITKSKRNLGANGNIGFPKGNTIERGLFGGQSIQNQKLFLF